MDACRVPASVLLLSARSNPLLVVFSHSALPAFPTIARCLKPRGPSDPPWTAQAPSSAQPQHVIWYGTGLIHVSEVGHCSAHVCDPTPHRAWHSVGAGRVLDGQRELTGTRKHWGMPARWPPFWLDEGDFLLPNTNPLAALTFLGCNCLLRSPSQCHIIEYFLTSCFLLFGNRFLHESSSRASGGVFLASPLISNSLRF